MSTERRAAELPGVPGVVSPGDVARTAGTILAAQEASGAIAWHRGADADPWDHVECAMALSAAGEWAAAQRAYEWLRATQRPDGSWPMRTRGATIVDGGADSNQCAYVATGVWHHFLVTSDEAFARRMWPVVRGAIEFVLALQAPAGEICWARDIEGRLAPEALLAGCASIHASFRCATALAELVDEAQPDWEWAAGWLAEAVARRRASFADRRRYSMDWYYPVLGGAVRGAAGKRLLGARWEEFVVPGLGVRCVADRPWVTGAETCELALALDALGQPERARSLLADMQHLRDDDGAYWTGYVFEDGVRWPIERSTWTSAAVILTADALSQTTGGAGIFRSVAAAGVAAAEAGEAAEHSGSDAFVDALENP